MSAAANVRSETGRGIEGTLGGRRLRLGRADFALEGKPVSPRHDDAVVLADDSGELLSIVVRNLALCLLAIAGGDVVRSRHEAIEEESQRRLGEERLRIAREVHDVVAHAMVAINVQAGVAAHRLDQDPEQARTALRAIKDTSGEALADLRSTLGVLRGKDVAAPLGPTGGLDDLDELCRECELEPPYAVVLAVACAAHRVPLEAALLAFLHALAASLISAGIRLIPLGQTDGQRLTAALEGTVQELAAAVMAGSLEDLGSAVPLIELLSMAHETQYTRLFRS